MDHTLENVLESAKAWPDDDRAELLEAAREIESRRTGVYVPSAEEMTAIEEGRADIDRGDFIAGAELDAFLEEITSEGEAFSKGAPRLSQHTIAYRSR